MQCTGKYFCSATGGADSGPTSLEGTPTDDKNGQQAFGAGKFRDINVNIPFDARNDVAAIALRNQFKHHLYCYLRD